MRSQLNLGGKYRLFRCFGDSNGLEKAYCTLDCSVYKIQRHKTMVCLGNSSLWLEYRAQEEVARHRLKRKADLSSAGTWILPPRP